MLFAEVMDKELTLHFIWSYFLTCGTIGFFCGLVRWWLSLVVAPFVSLMAFAHICELHDPLVGPDILAEAGMSYFVQSYLAIAGGCLLPVTGIAVGILFRRRT